MQTILSRLKVSSANSFSSIKFSQICLVFSPKIAAANSAKNISFIPPYPLFKSEFIFKNSISLNGFKFS